MVSKKSGKFLISLVQISFLQSAVLTAVRTELCGTSLSDSAFFRRASSVHPPFVLQRRQFFCAPSLSTPSSANPVPNTLVFTSIYLSCNHPLFTPSFLFACFVSRPPVLYLCCGLLGRGRCVQLWRRATSSSESNGVCINCESLKFVEWGVGFW